ncbi:uncharacterized protein LOC144132740 isoform X3 [Amblyomma americanum]
MASSRDGGEASSTVRVKFSSYQVERLQHAFDRCAFIDTVETEQLAYELGISFKQTRTWFQNKRAMIRRKAIKAAGRSYVPQLLRPSAFRRVLPAKTSPRGARRCSAQGAPPAASVAQITGAVDGLVRAHSPSTGGAQGQAAQHQLGHLALPGPSGAGFLPLSPQLMWRQERLSPSASTPSPALSGSEDDLRFSSSLEMQPHRLGAATPTRQYGSYDSLWPGLPAAPPTVSTTFSHSAPFVWPADRSDGAGQPLQHWQTPYDAAATGQWQGQPQLQQMQAPPQLPVGEVQQHHEAALGPPDESQVLPSQPWQPDCPSEAPPDDEDDGLPGIEVLTALMLELETPRPRKRTGGAENI